MFSKIMVIVFLLATFMLHVTPFDDLNQLARDAAKDLKFKDLEFKYDMDEANLVRSYRKLAAFYHPDKNRERVGWAHEKSIALNNAKDAALKLLHEPRSRDVFTTSQPRPTPTESTCNSNIDASICELIKTLQGADIIEFSYKNVTHELSIKGVPELIPDSFFTALVQIDSHLSEFAITGRANMGKLKAIPAQIGLLQHLEALALFNCGIESLPDEIANLKELSYLNLSKNKLTRLPSGIYDLPKLEELMLVQNTELRELSLELMANRMKKLKSLNIKSTPIDLGNSAVKNALKQLKDRGVRIRA